MLPSLCLNDTPAAWLGWPGMCSEERTWMMHLLHGLGAHEHACPLCPQTAQNSQPSTGSGRQAAPHSPSCGEAKSQVGCTGGQSIILEGKTEQQNSETACQVAPHAAWTRHHKSMRTAIIRAGADISAPHPLITWPWPRVKVMGSPRFRLCTRDKAEGRGEK